MKMATDPLVPCGKPQGAGADGMVDALPLVKCMARGEPVPNLETLKTILRLHGCPEKRINVIADGVAPREFHLGMTRFWKIRDAFYSLANAATHRAEDIQSVDLSLNAVMSMIAENINPKSLSFPEAEKVGWNNISINDGDKALVAFWFPQRMPLDPSTFLITACRLFVLYSIWTSYPALLPVDFSSAMEHITDGKHGPISDLIIAAIEAGAAAEPAMPVSTATDYLVPTNVRLLLDVLQGGPMFRRELEQVLHVRRGVLLKHFLGPAVEMGLIEMTEHGSSPNQRYKLTATAVIGARQAHQKAATGLPEPVPVDLKHPGKQAEVLGKSIFEAETVLRARRSTPAIRLARYCRWPEAERALIYLFRVERVLRNAFANGKWKHLGIPGPMPGLYDWFPLENGLFCATYHGEDAGMSFRAIPGDKNELRCSITIGPFNVLNMLARNPELDLAACTETERNEMARLSEVIPPAMLYLANFYGQRFDVPRGLDQPYHRSSSVKQPDSIEPFTLYLLGVPMILFHGKGRAPLFHMARIDLEGGTLLLPITYYASSKDLSRYSKMPEVPDTPILYNSELIAANPGATVILTDELGIPLVNDSDNEHIFSSWYGGMEVIDKLDYGLLEGHPVRWLCFDSGDGPVEMYEKAVKVGTIFQQHGRKIAFQVFDRAMWSRNVFGMETGRYESSRSLSFDELMAEAAKYGVGGCGSAEVADLHVYTMDELLKLKPEEFILTPVLMPGFYCLIYGGSGVAKTWFALHLAICLSQGQAPFKHWEFCGTDPLNVLYVAGEMRESEYGKRLRKLLADQKANPHFGLIREDLDLTTEADQETITKAVKELKSKVVVLDNLSTLATNGHTEGQFEKILGFIRKLQADGIIVLLVHHENREGGFKGSGKIELIADQSLHLFSAGNGDKIELLVRAEKIRMTSRAEQAAFRTEFNPKVPVGVWPVFELTEEQRRRLDIDDPLGEVERNVGKKRKNNQLAWKYLNDDERAIAILDDMLNGCLDDVIAADLAVRESVISDFKQQYGISPEALDLHLAEAKEIAKNNSGKITPNELAPILWKLLTDNKK